MLQNIILDYTLETNNKKGKNNNNNNGQKQLIISFLSKDNKKVKIGFVRFCIEYSQITICLLFIYEKYRCQGYGSKSLYLFEKYILENYKMVKDIVLIPEHFNGHDKNGLCLFYEKNGFVQESKGLPVYIKNLKTQ
jgi:hypothetical protein